MPSENIDFNNLTPMFRQYFGLKEKYPGSLLLFRCGDFYEMYGKDAIKGAKAMEIVVTCRDAGKNGRIEMAGIPYHALDNYLKMLVNKGIKVAVCEQIEDPKKSKGLVKRDVVRVITSGTILDPCMLEEDQNNYLMGIVSLDKNTGIAVADVSTGELRITGVNSENVSRLKDEIFRIFPSEVVLHESVKGIEVLKEYLEDMEIPFTIKDDPIHGEIYKEILKTVFETKVLSQINWDILPEVGMASAVVINYLHETQKTQKHSLNQIELYDLSDFMVLDSYTWRNLELTQTMMERQKKGSLLWVVDETKTGMGARLLRTWLERPLIEPDKINARLLAVDEMVNYFTFYEEIVGCLKSIYDIERITSKIVYGSVNARDFLALKNSITPLPYLKEILSKSKSSMLKTLYESLDILEDLRTLIEESIKENPPISLKEGNIIKDGYNKELDKLRKIRSGARQWIAQLEQKEREKTGIKSLKVKFNNVFGYFIEVTKPNLSLVPESYIRKQTVANGERFISPELKEYESQVLGAEEKIFELEYNLFIKLRDYFVHQSQRLQYTSRVIANLDVLASFATIAMRGNYCKPEILKEGLTSIKGGRHPVVEKVLKESFVPNDTDIGSKDSRFHVITGPNMSGKSTYLRQIGLICIMAQMGSFVPADSARIGIVDRIFTRVGASDNLHQGKSTFLVEMTETANIIKNASHRSLILLDEIGRGTSTYDGLSIAWSVSEYIHNKIKARTLFATHFHQLTELGEILKDVKNYRVSVKETNKEIIFLHRIIPGGTDKSYGIYVAKIAGLPMTILKRAKEILEQLESSYEENRKTFKKSESIENNFDDVAYQLTFFDMVSNPIAEEIKKINPDELSPKEALAKIYELKNKFE